MSMKWELVPYQIYVAVPALKSHKFNTITDEKHAIAEPEKPPYILSVFEEDVSEPEN